MRRPYIGKVINFFETAAGENFVKVSWYYHTEETKQGINTALPKVLIQILISFFMLSLHCESRRPFPLLALRNWFGLFHALTTL